MSWGGCKDRRTDAILQTNSLSGSVKIIRSEVAAAEDRCVVRVEVLAPHGNSPGLSSDWILEKPVRNIMHASIINVYLTETMHNT